MSAYAADKDSSSDGELTMNIKIFTMTHKDFEFPESADRSIYIPLHVGRALTPLHIQDDTPGHDTQSHLESVLDFTEAARQTYDSDIRDSSKKPGSPVVRIQDIPGDDTGDNISDKNKSFCELTGLYWAWKNAEYDIAGMAQYRRFFIEGDNNEVLSKSSIEDLLSKYDMLISRGTFVREESIRSNYEIWHKKSDLELTEKIIKDKFPEYTPALYPAFSGRLFSGGNLFIAKKDVFDAYCSWLFSILFEVEKNADTSGYDEYQKRIYGFLSERLIRVFALAGSYRICELPVGIA